MSDDSSDDEDSDFDEGSHCYARRGIYPPGLSDNDHSQIIWVECDQCHCWYHYLRENIDSEHEIESYVCWKSKKLKRM